IAAKAFVWSNRIEKSLRVIAAKAFVWSNRIEKCSNNRNPLPTHFSIQPAVPSGYSKRLLL
ncbi:MAG: hypothetical protein MUC81_05845, partial [Bacteroidia bacterium]|nr:hypothetical protein [Bacteroidia bacterium]